MAYTQTDLDNLEKAIAQGAKRVKYSDKEVECRSIGEMLQAKRIIKRALGKKPRNERCVATFSKGLCSRHKAICTTYDNNLITRVGREVYDYNSWTACTRALEELIE